MNTKRVLAVFIVLLIIISAVFLISKNRKSKNALLNLPSPTPSITEQIQNQFGGITIPENVEKIELKNVSNIEGMGIATRSEVLADLPDLATGESYQVYLGNGTKTVLVGTMRQAKGGWILEYNSSKFPGYNQIFVKKGSEVILEGSFQ